MFILNYLYAKFSKPYLFGIDNASTYKYNMMIKEKINFIVNCFNIAVIVLSVAGIITQL